MSEQIPGMHHNNRSKKQTKKGGGSAATTTTNSEREQHIQAALQKAADLQSGSPEAEPIQRAVDVI
jgi:hypothetical protein